MPAPRVSIGPETRSYTFTSKPAPCTASPAQSPPMEPPATAILSGPSAPDIAARLARLGFHQVPADGAGEEADAIDKHGRNARHTQNFAHAALHSAVGTSGMKMRTRSPSGSKYP